MKMVKILQAVTLFSILIFAVSCRSSKPTSGRTYPRSSPSPNEYPTKTYPVVYEETSSLPPGQAKKVYGTKSAKSFAPGQRKKYARYPLIIVRTPDIVITRYSDGRYYYKNSDGLMYWKGSDDRYYIDEKHLKDMEYDQSNYDDWKGKGQKNNNKDKEDKEQKGKDEKAQKDKNDQKPKNENSQKGKGNSKNKS